MRTDEAVRYASSRFRRSLAVCAPSSSGMPRAEYAVGMNDRIFLFIEALAKMQLRSPGERTGGPSA